ncbi:MAG: hypothetical protein IPK26_06075 [Planctomycetes bacterium]|nr:hypothetical protein [Planctomycetota bacterium]
MESVNQVKEALSARSRTATLDELRSEGRKKVRLIKAEHVAQMIAEAVHAAIESSGLLSQQEVDQLIDKSRNEFREILKERQAEVERAQEVEDRLADRERELEQLREQLTAVQQDFAAAQAEIEQNRRTLAELEEQTAAAPAAPAVSASTGAPPDLLMSLVNELAGLKAQLAIQGAPQPVAAAAAPAPAPDFTAALEKLTGSLNDRLEKLGRKMGVSGAVEAGDVKFDGMFKDDGKQLESNMDNIQVKQKAGGGIAANLARLKKLKGGG